MRVEPSSKKAPSYVHCFGDVACSSFADDSGQAAESIASWQPWSAQAKYLDAAKLWEWPQDVTPEVLATTPLKHSENEDNAL